MFISDVNLLLYAFDPSSPFYSRARSWLGAMLDGRDAFGLPEIVLASVVRLLTNPRVFRTPAPIGIAMDYVEVLRRAPSVIVLNPGPSHFGIFSELCRAANAVGDLVPDAYLAAMALEHDATLCTNDRGFRRFAGLKLAFPLLDPAAASRP